MDRKTELAHLAIADKAVADGHRHIAQQEQRLSDLDRDGHDTQKASALLAVYWQMQNQHVAHRNSLLRRLRQEPARSKLRSEAIFRPGI